MKGIIALDIDGTIATPGDPISQETLSFLSNLIKNKWYLIFITGRAFPWAKNTLKALNAPYYLAVQNGAIILEMPTEEIIDKKYLDSSIIPIMEEICEKEPTDFVIYAGYEHQNQCYYRPSYFSAELLEYVEARTKAFQEKWIPLHSFESLGIKQFPSIKCFGLHSQAQNLATEIEKKLNLHIPLIRDPYREDYYVAQATHPEVSKGYALSKLIKKINLKCPVIAAGDDYNDCSMLDIADIKIVMSTAPKDMLLNCDIIAPPASKQGIIEAITLAINSKNKID